jgi:hypothetical protein
MWYNGEIAMRKKKENAVELIKKYLGTVNEPTQDSIFIHPGGAMSECIDHAISAKLAGTSLEEYLKQGGVRIKFFRSLMCVEAIRKTTVLQDYEIKNLLIREKPDVVKLQAESGYYEFFNYDGVRWYQVINYLE